jgi:uncharacterized protein (TIGR02757 family)
VPRASSPDVPLLGEHLLRLRDEWSGAPLSSDPLEFAHRYSAAADREVTAFLAASLAFGRVASIRTTLSRVLAPLGPEPAAFLERWNGSPIAGLSGIVHRWVGEDDLHSLLRAVAAARRDRGSLEALFVEGDDGGADLVPALTRFHDALRKRSRAVRPPRGLQFLLPRPELGGACKRAHLFLRWMVRSGPPDLGLWKAASLSPARLLLPMDTHVHRISRYLGLTRRPAADLAASREATGILRRIDPGDPVSFDWALSRLGILTECVREIRLSHCERCAVRPICRMSKAKARNSARTPRPTRTAARSELR